MAAEKQKGKYIVNGLLVLVGLLVLFLMISFIYDYLSGNITGLFSPSQFISSFSKQFSTLSFPHLPDYVADDEDIWQNVLNFLGFVLSVIGYPISFIINVVVSIFAGLTGAFNTIPYEPYY